MKKGGRAQIVEIENNWVMLREEVSSSRAAHLFEPTGIEGMGDERSATVAFALQTTVHEDPNSDVSRGLLLFALLPFLPKIEYHLNIFSCGFDFSR